MPGETTGTGNPVTGRPRFLLMIRKLYQENGQRQWTYLILDMQIREGNRVVSGETSPEWTWGDALIIGLRCRQLTERAGVIR